MIPHVWVAVVLVLASFRLFRLVGYDELPLLVRFRKWATKEYEVRPALDDLHMRTWTIVHDLATRHGDRLYEPSRRALEDLDYEYERRQQASYVRHGRPAIEKLLSCPWCAGWWISLAMYVGWAFEPKWTVYFAAPWALSAAVGLVTKHLDP